MYLLSDRSADLLDFVKGQSNAAGLASELVVFDKSVSVQPSLEPAAEEYTFHRVEQHPSSQSKSVHGRAR